MSHGDFSTNVAFIHATPTKTKPRDIADKILKYINENKPDFIEKVEIAGSGFINFFMSGKFFHDTVSEILKQKEKFGQNKQEFAKKQLEFYKAKGVNPAAGCLPQIAQIVILIALFQVFQTTLVEGAGYNTRFFYLDLTKPDLFSIPAINLFGFKLDKFPGIFLVASAVIQFISSKLMMPAAVKSKNLAEKTKGQSDDMAAAMQQQMLYLMPLMTLFIGFKFASGLVLYWLTFSLVMLFQQLWLDHGQTQKT